MTRPLSSLLALTLLGGLVPLIPGCKQTSTISGNSSIASAPVTYKKYHLRGMIVAKSIQASEVTVRHGDIPGVMPAMTMVYKVKDPAVVQELQPGDRIAAEILVPSDSDNYLLDEVVITDESHRNEPPAMLPAHQLMVGEKVPDIPLVNQDGATIHLQNYLGKAILVTFIYTRCPMPTACPLISSHFYKVNESLARDPKAYAASHLISISLDPNYDRPPVLRQYGLAYLDDNAAGFSHWEFTDTTPGDLKKLAEAFGLQYSAEGNQITHTMRTILIGPDSKVVQTWDGSGWDPNTVAAAVQAASLKAAR